MTVSSVHRRKVKREIFFRANGLCEICRWAVGDDLHHVYGRGKTNRDWREQSDACLLVCRPCHPFGFVHERTDDGNSVAEVSLRDVLAGRRTHYAGLTING